MKKKFLLFLLAIVAGVGTIFAYDKEVKIGDLYYGITKKDKTAMVVAEEFDSPSNYATLQTANIPQTVIHEGITYNVTEIYNLAFEWSKVKTVIIPNSVERIGASAFEGTRLNSVTIGNGVSKIGSHAFGCFIDTVYLSDLAAFCKIEFTGRESTPLRGSTVLYVGGKQTSNLVIDRGVTRISENAFTQCNSITSVTITGSVKSIGKEAFIGCDSLRSVVIGNNVDGIGIMAFCGCDSLNSVVIGNGLTYIGGGAFVCGTWKKSVYCYATVPPKVEKYLSLNYYSPVADGSIYVPSTSVNAYKETEWHDSSILGIYPISATYVETDKMRIQITTSTTADIEWLAVDEATSYELEVKEGAGNAFCNVIFNGEGQMSDIIYHAPSRYNAPQGTQSAGFSYTVMGLTSGTTYNVTITAKAANGSTLNTETASFTTTGEQQGIEDVNVNNTQSKKIIRDGNVYILRGEKVFTLQGQEVK